MKTLNNYNHNFLNQIKNLNGNSRIVFVRSASIGDFVVVLPFIKYLIVNYNIKVNNIDFLIFNSSGINPVQTIFGSYNDFSLNTYVFNINPRLVIKSFLKGQKFFRKRKKDIEIISLLPFSGDSFKSYKLKLVLTKLIIGFKPEYFGFQRNKNNSLSESQYLFLFDFYGIKKVNIKNYNFFDSLITQNILSTTGSKNKKIVLYITSRLQMKIWPSQKYKELVIRLNESLQADFFLIGASEDITYCDTFIKSLKDEVSGITIRNIAGQYNILETISFLRDCHLFITNDGSPLHFGSASNIPIVALFTYKEPIGAWEPILNDTLVSFRMECSCKHCYKVECANSICITDISVQSVFDACINILNNKLVGLNSIVILNGSSKNYLV